MTIEYDEVESPSTTVKLNSNTYINLATVVLIIFATLWIKDGQYAAQSSAKDAVIVSSQVAKDAIRDLQNYKDLQTQTSQVINGKIDVLTQIVKEGGSIYRTKSESKAQWRELQALNPSIKVPESP